MNRMPFDLKRIFLILGLFLSLSFVAPPPTYAIWVEDKIKEKLGNLWSEHGFGCATDLNCWVRNASTAGANYSLKVLVGEDAGEIAKSTEESFNNTGLLAVVGAIGDQTYNYPPDIHLAGYFRHKLGDNLLSTPTYAKTWGEERLGGAVLEVWEKMRDLSYSFFILIMVVIGFMIMLRKQIAPRVVVSFTSALPKIFFSLVLITFSYPIVALFIDVGIVWASSVLLNLGIGEIAAGLPSPPSGGITLGAFGEFCQRIAVAAFRIFVVPAEGLLTAILLISVVLFLFAALCVLSLVILQLLYRYAWIIILTVFAPFLLLLGSLPGQEGLIADWFKRLAVNTLVFPAILLMVYISSSLLVGALAGKVEHITGWPEGIAGLLPTVAPTALGVVSLIILLMSFKVPGIIENAIKGRK